MCLTPMCRDASGYRIRFAGIVTAVSSTQTLPAQATVSFWYLDPGNDYIHVHIAKDNSTVTVTLNNDTITNYTGTIGSTYAELIKNVLTHSLGEWNSAWADVFCTDQLAEASIFVKGSGTSCRPLEAELPSFSPTDDSSTMFTGGTPSLSHAGYSNGLQVFVDNTGYSTNEWDGGNAPQWAQYGLPASHKAIAYDMVASASYYTGHFPKNWTIQGSNDGTNWVILDTRTNQSAGSARMRKRYVIQSPGTYTHYRLNITATNSGQVIVLGAWLMYATLPPTQYGSSGVHLDFADEANLGNDVSSNDNDWTISGSQSTTTP